MRSVIKYLPLAALHEIVFCSSYQQTDIERNNCLSKSRYIAFVDDDDYLLNDSLNICLKTIKQTGVGVVFTDEFLVTEKGLPHPSNREIRSNIKYSDLYSQPLALHHLAIIDTLAIPGLIKNSIDPFIAGSDWLIKAGAALNKGAIHIPIYGYAWRQHTNGRSVIKSEVKIYNDRFSELKQMLKPYTNFKDKEIPSIKL
jgi:hypothetical protein